MTTPVLCVSVFGPESSVLYLWKEAGHELDLTIETELYLALAEMNRALSSTKARNRNGFIARFHKTQNAIAWGSMTNLKYRIIILTKASLEVSDQIMRALTDQIATYTIDAMMDPFYQPFTPITSPKFISRVSSIVKNTPTMIRQSE